MTIPRTGKLWLHAQACEHFGPSQGQLDAPLRDDKNLDTPTCSWDNEEGANTQVGQTRTKMCNLATVLNLHKVVREFSPFREDIDRLAPEISFSAWHDSLADFGTRSTDENPNTLQSH